MTELYTTVAGGQDVFLLRRGEVDNKQGKAEPAFLQVLATRPMPATAAKSADGQRRSSPHRLAELDDGRRARRRAACWPACIVNRLWQHHFGKGIVGTPNDFGAQGERPTHPELLDWLAGELDPRRLEAQAAAQADHADARLSAGDEVDAGRI